MQKLLTVYHGTGTIIIQCPICDHVSSLVRGDKGRYCADKPPCPHLNADRDSIQYSLYIKSDIVIREFIPKER